MSEYTDRTHLRLAEIEILIIWDPGQKEWMIKNDVHVAFNHGKWRAKKGGEWLTFGFGNPLECIRHLIDNPQRK
jgi:hypothetical protein